MDADALEAAIRAAWAGASAPARASVASDESATEASRVAMFFAGRRWEDVSLDVLRDEYDGDASACLCFMSPQAFWYYLPAYMLIAIDAYDEADVVGHAAVNALVADDLTRRSGLTAPQRRAIVAFLEFMQDRHADDFLPGELERALLSWRSA